MPRLIRNGPKRHLRPSQRRLVRITIDVLWRRLTGRAVAKDWSAAFEIGNLFWREQFTSALAMDDMAEGRRYFNSLQTLTDEVYDVARRTERFAHLTGDWITPATQTRSQTLLYMHGGGYAFDGFATDRIADLLCHNLGLRVFAPRYRLTPEHPHPAQAEDALASYRYLLNQGIAPQDIILAGDSAGGHMVLMLLHSLRAEGLPQPALCIGLCPWTDIRARGESLHDNDRYDLVQGWMALKFGTWLVGDSGVDPAEISPITHDFTGLAPLYLQAGGREVLVDMIRDFARKQKDLSCDVTLDVWPRMTHDFQAHGQQEPESAAALQRIAAAIDAYTHNGARRLPPIVETEVSPALPKAPHSPPA